MQKIFSGDDRARELGFKSYREFVEKMAARSGFVFDSTIAIGNPLNAFITYGRWAATCECGESYYVSPTDTIGYCYGGCGNAVLGGLSRSILFPDNRDEIEAELLKRELNGSQVAFDRLGTQHALKTGLFQPRGAPRNWDGQSLDEMQAEHEKVKEIREELMRQESEHGENSMADRP